MTKTRKKIVESYFKSELVSVFGKSFLEDGKPSKFDELSKKRDLTLTELREKESELFSDEVESDFSGKSEEERKKFDQYRSELSIARERLETETFAKIVGRFEALSKELDEGIKALQINTASIKKTVDFFSTLSRVLGIIGRIFL
jgi:hypothetical protein